MIYDLSNKLGAAQAQARLEKLIQRGALVDITDKSHRSLQQNSYLHLLIGAVALETGCPLEYAKTEYYKHAANAPIYERKVADKFTRREVTLMRSSAELTAEEMALTITRFKDWAAEQGIYLPEPNDAAILQEIERQMSIASRYL